jgi:NAD(P)-dependent dehydrogenase (short-subunit alcohol dehydrogenase family)
MTISSLPTTQLREFVTTHVTEPLLAARRDILCGRPVIIGPTHAGELAPELDRVAAFSARGLADGLRAEIGSGSVVAKSLTLPPLVDELASSRLRHQSAFRDPIEKWRGGDVLVTGASSGLGRATAELLASRGARVFAMARRKALLDELESHGGGRIIGLTADVSDPEQVANAISRWRDEHGGKSFKTVIHAAGGGHIRLLKNTDPGDIRADIATNVLGALLVARETLPFIAYGGHLAIVTSGAVFLPWTGGVVYATGKSATYGLARALAAYEAKERGIAVTAVTAGAFDSELWGHVADGKVVRLAMSLIRRAIPSANTAAAEMLSDIESGLLVSLSGVGTFILTQPQAAKLASRNMRYMATRLLE